MPRPLVTVICLCYNHAAFVQEAIESVFNQTYKPIQIIIVDDASTDNSVEVINNVIKRRPDIAFLPLHSNHGICKAFNKALPLVQGEFIIDFATDDVMLPQRIEKQIAAFDDSDKQYGVVFTDAVYISETGTFIRNHFDYLFSKKLLTDIPEGDVYKDILSIYFVAAPTMMVRREVYDQLQGYDETLAYEDFDFWVRSSRSYKYHFLDEKLTKIRLTKKSMSAALYQKGDAQLYSTYLVCKKAMGFIKNEVEQHSLLKRIRYELRHAVFTRNKKEAMLLYHLLIDLSGVTFKDRFCFYLGKLNLPLSWMRNLYHSIMFPQQ